MGFSCSMLSKRSYIEGWFLGAGIGVKHWTIKTRPLFKRGYKVGFYIQTRSDLKYGFKINEQDGLKWYALFFGFGFFFISRKTTEQ